MTAPILYETHMHTPLCKHAHGEPGEYAAVAERRGLRGIIVTCHNPMPDGFGSHVRMSTDDWDTYVELVEQTRDAWSDRVDVRLGLECDYFPGYESFLEKQTAHDGLNYVLGSVHPQLPEFKNKFWASDALAFQRTYFDQLADAAETGFFDCISHPDLVKNMTASKWDVDAAMPDILLALDRIAATGVSMELNTSGANKTVPQMNPCPEMLTAMRERDIPVVIGADAHVPHRVADRYETALDLLQETGYETVGYFLNRRRVEVSIDDARDSLVNDAEVDVTATTR